MKKGRRPPASGLRLGIVMCLLGCATVRATPPLAEPLRAGMGPLIGEWSCGAAAHWSFEPDLGGAFVQARYAQQGADAVELKGHVGWDEDAARLLYGYASSDGSSETGGAGDWDGDELTFYGTLRDGETRLQLRRVFHLTARGFDWRLEVQQGDAWTKALEQSCSRD